MQATYQEKKEIVLRVQKLDSMGRTAEVRAAMEKNDPPRMPKLGEATKAVHEIVGETCGEFPKAMYRLALRNGKPAGDIKDPDYPTPWDLAQQLGLTDSGFKVIGKNGASPGHVVIRLPYITRIVGALRDDLTIDIEAAKAEEADLRRKGWVTAPHLIKGLPTPPAEVGFDPLPDDEPKPNGNGRAGKAA